jgi:hypothetical protein
VSTAVKIADLVAAFFAFDYCPMAHFVILSESDDMSDSVLDFGIWGLKDFWLRRRGGNEWNFFQTNNERNWEDK